MVTVDADWAGQRLDNFLLRLLKGVPKTHVYRIIRSGEVRINKARVSADTRLQAGDQLRLPPVRTSARAELKARELSRHGAMSSTGLAAPARQFPLLYEDEQVLAVNKPAGVAVHGGSGVAFGVIEQLRMARPAEKFLELVHRLDRETSGVLLVAKKRMALKNLQEQEGLSNKEAKEAANIALDMQAKYGTLYQALQDNSFKERWAQMDDATRRYIGKLTASSSAYGAQLGLQGTLGAARYGYERELAQQQGLARKYVFENIGPGGAFVLEYTNAPDKTKFINDKVSQVMGGASGVVDVPWTGK
jgi:23S rRNA-/tRNA-specific pseudouridylate synthase